MGKYQNEKLTIIDYIRQMGMRYHTNKKNSYYF